ncbi:MULTISPECIES: hypothetical protein [Streptomyces]|nr:MULTISPECIES: hypothetical protein [Streptomyces]
MATVIVPPAAAVVVPTNVVADGLKSAAGPRRTLTSVQSEGV